MVQKEIFLQGQLGLGMVDDSSPTDHPTWVRFLESHQEKEKAEESEMDYTVLSVAVMTLGMLMVVEVLIHKLDNAARGRPYFTAVLTNIYSERKQTNNDPSPSSAFVGTTQCTHMI